MADKRNYYVWKSHPAHGTVIRNQSGTWVPFAWFYEQRVRGLTPKAYTLAGAKREATRLNNAGEAAGLVIDQLFQKYIKTGWFEHHQRQKRAKSNPRTASGVEYRIKPMHIDLVRAGDVILRDGELKVLSKEHIKKGPHGKTLWGDSYRLGYQPVLVADIVHAKPKSKRNPKTLTMWKYKWRRRPGAKLRVGELFAPDLDAAWKTAYRLLRENYNTAVVIETMEKATKAEQARVQSGWSLTNPRKSRKSKPKKNPVAAKKFQRLGYKQMHMLRFMRRSGVKGRFHIAEDAETRSVAESLKKRGIINIDKAYTNWIVWFTPTGRAWAKKKLPARKR